jgi:sugar/nucleoside kinase (ribokinase family)
MEPIEENLPAMAEKLLSLGVRQRVILHTPKIGLCAEKNGKITSRPSCPLPKGFVKGKTGAGDAFCAAMLYALHEELPLSKSLRVANAAARFNLFSATSTDGAPTIAEIEEFLSKQ